MIDKLRFVEREQVVPCFFVIEQGFGTQWRVDGVEHFHHAAQFVQLNRALAG